MRPLVPLSAVKLPGRHLLSDVLAASAAGYVAGVSPAAMERAVRAFDGLAHTLEAVGEIGGVRFVNDSKATNVAAARASIECFERDVVVIMGGGSRAGTWPGCVRFSARARARSSPSARRARTCAPSSAARSTCRKP